MVRLIERVGAQTNPKQKRVLCINKIDLVEKKKDLLKVSEQFKDLPGYDRWAACHINENLLLPVLFDTQD